jgi:LysR family positive regulator for ilvC
MEYDDLRLFLHLSRTLHFGRTSKECHVSASALSRTVQRLEAELDAPLFVRDRRSVELTPAGELFASHAAEVLERFVELKKGLSRADEQLSGTITLFASVTACQSFLPGVLARFRRDYPDIHIQLETGHAVDALGMLARGAVDVSVAALPAETPRGLVSRVLLVTPLVFVSPASECEVSRLAAKKPLPWAELPQVLPATGIARAAVESFFRKRRVKPKVYGEVLGNEALLSLVSLGCGVGVVPRIVYEKSPLRSEVRVLDVEPRLEELRVGVCTERQKLKQAVIRAFWDSVEARGHTLETDFAS